MHGDRCDSFDSQCGSDDADGGIFHAGYLLYLQYCCFTDLCGNRNLFLCVVRNDHRKLSDFAGGRGLQPEKQAEQWQKKTDFQNLLVFCDGNLSGSQLSDEPLGSDLDHLGLCRGAMWRSFCYNVFIEKIK